MHRFAVSIVHIILDHQIKTVYRVLSSGRFAPTVAALQLLTELALVPRSPAPDMLYRLVVSGFNVWPKLLSRREATREKEIINAAKRRKAEDQPNVRSCSVNFVLAILKR